MKAQTRLDPRRLARGLVTLALAALLLSGTPGCGLSALIAVGVVSASSSSSSNRIVPAPTVTGVSPTQGSHGGGVVVTITGSNFPADATVSVGGVQATNVSLGAGGALTATVPYSSTVGPANVVVTNPIGGSGTLTGGFTYTNTPTQVSVAALSGSLSQNVVITVTLTDVESDPTDLLLEVDSGAGFQPIPANQILSGSLQGLASSASGLDQVITWDSRATFPSQNASNLVLRITPTDTSDNQVGTPVTSTVFSIVNNTPVSVDLIQPGDDAFNVALRFRVSDADLGDQVTVTGLTFSDLTRGVSGSLSVASGQGLGAVPFSAGGTESTTVWNSLADLGFGNNRLVQVFVTVSDGNTSFTAQSTPFFVSNGPFKDQTVFDSFIDVHGAAVGDVHGDDGLPDLIAMDTAIDVPLGTEDTTNGGAIAVLANRGTGGGSGFAGARVVRTLADYNLQVGNTDGLLAPNGAAAPPYLAAPAGPVAPFPNYFRGRIIHPSEATVINADADAAQELVVAHSPHAVNADFDLLDYAAVVLANAGADLADPNSQGANLRDHQLLLRFDQDASGVLDFSAPTPMFSSAPRSSTAPIHTNSGPVVWEPGHATPNVGYFVQDLATAELDGAGGGGEDLVVLHGVADIEDATQGDDRRGAVSLLKRGASGLQSAASLASSGMIYLDPSAMGVFPTQVAIADITSAAHDGVVNGDGGIPFPVAPNVAVAAGLPDILVANTGDDSLTFYLQTAPAANPDTDAPTYHGVHLPLANLFLALTGTAPPAGDTRGVAIADLNGDHANDFVVVGQLSRTVLVFIYDPLSGGPLSLNANQAGGDVNAGPYPQSAFPAGVLPFRLAGVISLPNLLGGRPTLADVSGDGRPDIVVPVGANNEVATFVNSGVLPARPAFGESRPTPVFGSGFADPAADVLPTSPTPTTFTSEFVPFEAFAEDFDRDRRTDLAVASGLSFDFSVFYQGAAGTLDRFVPVPTNAGPFLLDRGDLDQDGVPELVASVPSNNTVAVFRRNSSGALALATSYDVSAVNNVFPYVVSPQLPFYVQVDDADGDGNLDLLVSSQLIIQGQTALASNAAQVRDQVGGWLVFPGAPPGLPSASTAVVRTSTFPPQGFAASAGDFLGDDGIPDVLLSLVSSNGVDLYRGLGGGDFAGTADPATGVAQVISISNGSSTGVDVIDLNGDGYPDALVATSDVGRGLEVYWGDPSGTPPSDPLGSELKTYAIDTSAIGPPVGILVVDVGGPLNPNNGQPMLDVIITGFTDQSGGVLFQTDPGSGDPRTAGFVAPTFAAVPLLVGGEPGQIAVGDLNGDGSPDIAIPSGTDNTLSIYYRDPAVDPLATSTLGVLFQGPALFATANSPSGCAIMDVDGDGKNDVVVAARGASSLNVFLQR